jgi:hypothetical protein
VRKVWFHPVRLSRDAVLFMAGLAGVAYETLDRDAERPTLLILFGAMIGLPTVFRADEKRHEDATKGDDPHEKS